jgi:alpha-galactosidase
MMIHEDKQRRLFLIQTAAVTYALGIDDGDRLRHLYWGSRIDRSEDLPVLPGSQPGRISTENMQACPLEYRTLEGFEYGEPALHARFADHVAGVQLVYREHWLQREDKRQILTIRLADRFYPLTVDLEYVIYEGLDLISRRSVIKNEGADPIRLEIIRSASLYVPRGRTYRLTHLSGNWGREFQKERLVLTHSKVDIENRRGTSGGPQAVPFFALDSDAAATETTGEIWYGVLHWSGNFRIAVEMDPSDQVTVSCGIGEFDAAWQLQPGTSFTTPQVTIGYTGGGFEQMSEALYAFQYDYLAPRAKATQVRPIIYNSWYPYEFDINEEKLLGLAEKAAAIGVELFVIDDGWFRGRTSDKAGLGDWFVCTERFPRGLEVIADRCHSLGLQFGIWVEPEMVNPDSDLYRAHPDWVIHYPTRARSLQRNQMVLNFARDDVRDFAIDFLDRLITDYRLDYLKWDMNRYMTEPGWPDAAPEDQASLTIRYIQNLYAVWEHLNQKHPHVLYENCAHGGARADFGMVAYADRINRSDNADPVDVMKLHEGFTTLFLPKTAGGAGNIATSPNSINGRVTPLRFRAHLGMMGSMSIGINLLLSSPEELAELKSYLSAFKALRPDLQNGWVYRLVSAYEHPYAIFQYVNRSRTATTVFAFGHGLNFRQQLPRIRLRGLLPEKLYRSPDGNLISGQGLMNLGLAIRLRGDYDSCVLTYRMENRRES